jgi:hypothetical protein
MESQIKIIGHTGTGGERGRIISPDGIATALSATDYKDPQKIIVCVERNGVTEHEQSN